VLGLISRLNVGSGPGITVVRSRRLVWERYQERAGPNRYKRVMFKRVAIGLVGICLGFALAGSGVAARGEVRTSSLIVLDRSIGGAAMGETRPMVEKRLGRGVILSTTTDRSARPAPVHIVRVSYGAGALVVTYVSMAKQPPKAAILETTSSRYRTGSGVGVGSTVGTLLSLGGVKCYGPAGVECQHGYTALNRPGTTFRLDRPGGTVVYIAIALGH
jgi:hypothetical protein